jgi:hypothetical protein
MIAKQALSWLQTEVSKKGTLQLSIETSLKVSDQWLLQSCTAESRRTSSFETMFTLGPVSCAKAS